MRLYRYLGQDIDVTVVTDGIGNQKRVFITESLRGVTVPGEVVPEGEEPKGQKFIALGWPWVVGEAVMHEELVAFAEENGLTLELTPENLNVLEVATAAWNADELEISVKTTIPQKRLMTIQFPSTVTLADSVERYGEISPDRKSVTGKMWKTMNFTLADLGLSAKAALEITVIADVKTITMQVTV